MSAPSLTPSLTPEPNHWVYFERSELNKVPSKPGCYVLTAFNGRVFYIGQSKNLHSRMGQHLEDPSKQAHTSAGKTFWFGYRLCDLLDLDNIERGWINEYTIATGVLPPFNKINPPT